jgi:hypothetical protein
VRNCNRTQALQADFAMARQKLSPDDFTMLHNEVSTMNIGMLPNWD